MTLDATAQNLASDVVAGVGLRLALHTADPGAGAANELSGGGYVRQPVAWNAATGGIAAMNASVEFDVGAVTIAWVTVWDSAGTTRYGKAQLGSPAVFPVAGIFRLLASAIDFSGG